MSNLELIGKGATAEVYKWDEDKILKLFNHGVSKDIVEKEYYITKKVMKLGIPIPKVYELTQKNNRYGIVFEKVNGNTMLKSAGKNPFRLLKDAKKLAYLHLGLHIKIVLDIPEQKKYIKDGILRAKMLSSAVKERIIDYLEFLPQEEILCHGDFHPENVLVFNDKDFIIDWLTAVKGNPLGDVARTSIILRFANPDTKSKIEGALIRAVQMRFNKNYIFHYMRGANIELKDMLAWELPMAAARLSENLHEQEAKKLIGFVQYRLENLKGNST